MRISQSVPVYSRPSMALLSCPPSLAREEFPTAECSGPGLTRLSHRVTSNCPCFTSLTQTDTQFSKSRDSPGCCE